MAPARAAARVCTRLAERIDMIMICAIVTTLDEATAIEAALEVLQPWH